jgi:hypothetical protein
MGLSTPRRTPDRCHTPPEAPSAPPRPREGSWTRLNRWLRSTCFVNATRISTRAVGFPAKRGNRARVGPSVSRSSANDRVKAELCGAQPWLPLSRHSGSLDQTAARCVRQPPDVSRGIVSGHRAEAPSASHSDAAPSRLGTLSATHVAGRGMPGSSATNTTVRSAGAVRETSAGFGRSMLRSTRLSLSL